MAANPQALVSVDEYLHTAYDSDCDYVDGVVVERNEGESEHSLLQSELIMYVGAECKTKGLKLLPEQRIRISPRRYRVPDLCVVRGRGPFPPVIEQAPLVCIEILSREDRMNRVMQRAADYAALGVPNVWIFDPRERIAYVYLDGGIRLAQSGFLESSESGLTIKLEELFASMDE